MEPVTVNLTEKEKNLILENTFAPENLILRLKEADVKGKYLKVSYSYDELDELVGFIAAEFNHITDDSVKKGLDKLYEKLNEILETQYQ
ncbi:MAG: hypothetical protein H6681_00460 [Desulfobacteraceae bacterium]|nr:hypothetical protein [Desulfobacteraceae bacterium]